MNAIEEHLDNLIGKKVSVFRKLPDNTLEETSGFLEKKGSFYILPKNKFIQIQFNWHTVSLVYDNRIYLRQKVYGA